MFCSIFSEIRKNFKIDLKKLTIGTFETELAGMVRRFFFHDLKCHLTHFQTHDGGDSFTITYEYDEKSSSVEFKISDILELEQHFEPGNKYLRFVPKPSSADLFMCMIPEGETIAFENVNFTYWIFLRILVRSKRRL